jgi:hypothetical protein
VPLQSYAPARSQRYFFPEAGFAYRADLVRALSRQRAANVKYDALRRVGGSNATNTFAPRSVSNTVPWWTRHFPQSQQDHTDLSAVASDLFRRVGRGQFPLRDAVGLALRLMINAPIDVSEKIQTLLAQQAPAAYVIDAAVAGYRRQGTASWLAAGAAVVGDMPTEAWTALVDFARTGAEEVDPFIPIMARFHGISARARVDALREAASTTWTSVRQRILDEALDLPLAERRHILEVLVMNPDAIGETARELL